MVVSAGVSVKCGHVWCMCWSCVGVGVLFPLLFPFLSCFEVGGSIPSASASLGKKILALKLKLDNFNQLTITTPTDSSRKGTISHHSQTRGKTITGNEGMLLIGSKSSIMLDDGGSSVEFEFLLHSSLAPANPL